MALLPSYLRRPRRSVAGSNRRAGFSYLSRVVGWERKVGVAQACVLTWQVCAQSACDTEHLSDPINTIRTQACQSKLLFINAS